MARGSRRRLVTKSAFKILSAIEDSDDNDTLGFDDKGYRRTTLEPHRAQSLPNMLSSGSSLGEGLKAEAGCFDPRDIGFRYANTGCVGNIIV